MNQAGIGTVLQFLNNAFFEFVSVLETRVNKIILQEKQFLKIVDK